MKVVHIVPALFGHDGIVGGGERYAFELARHMARVVPTTLVTFGDYDREEELDGLTVRVLGRPWLIRKQRTNPFHFGVFQTLLGADVVHCHQQHVLTSSAVALWCRATKRRVFVSDLGGGGWDVSAYVSTDGWYDGHLHLSHYSRSIHGQAREPTARIVSGGVDVDKFSPNPRVDRDGSALFVGRLLPHKGVDDLIRALPPRMSLTVVGPQPDADMAVRMGRAAQGKSVSFKHGLDDEGLVAEYRRALCIVLPSVYRALNGTETRVPELLGQTLLEGMACGLPAICTNVASLPEVVEDGVTGFVVPPNDPETLGSRLSWLRDHPEEARAMGRAARERVLEHFTWSRVVQRCLDAYATAGPSVTFRKQCAALGVLLFLTAGFARASWTIGTQYHRMLQEPARGPFASIDRILHSSGHGSADQLLRAVNLAGLPEDARVAFAAPLSQIPESSFWQSYMTVSYLLYPRQVLPVLWCDGAEACTAAQSTTDLPAALEVSTERFLIVLTGTGGVPHPLTAYKKRTLAPGLTLLDLGLR
ncbi:MAG: glycosyltransferase family 4 protein [Vicinamibacterales bacterium]